jgi:hypothetical protein
MAITTAQLAAGITAGQTTFGLQNVSTNQSGLPAVGALPLPVGNPMFIDGEVMFCIAQPASGTVLVRGRGSEGTAAAAHDILAQVSVSSAPSDFGNPGPGQTTVVDLANDAPFTIGSDQTIVVPVSNTNYNVNKVTAAAIVLTAPSVYLNGLTLIFTSQTAAAHVITATSLFMDGTGTLPHTTATFNSKQGATITLVAENGFWNVTATNNVTIS